MAGVSVSVHSVMAHSRCLSNWITLSCPMSGITVPSYPIVVNGRCLYTGSFYPQNDRSLLVYLMRNHVCLNISPPPPPVICILVERWDVLQSAQNLLSTMMKITSGNISPNLHIQIVMTLTYTSKRKGRIKERGKKEVFKRCD